MERDQSTKTREYKLNPNARVWLGLEPVNPKKTFTRCLITYEDGGKKTAAFHSLDLKEITFKEVKIPIMTEYIAPSPAILNGTAQNYDPRDKLQWINHQPECPKLDQLYPDLDVLNQ